MTDELELVKLANKAREAIKDAEKKYDEAEAVYKKKVAAYLREEERALDYEKLIDMGKRLASKKIDLVCLARDYRDIEGAAQRARKTLELMKKEDALYA